jgi:hypothetical protein
VSSRSDVISALFAGGSVVKAGTEAEKALNNLISVVGGMGTAAMAPTDMMLAATYDTPGPRSALLVLRKTSRAVKGLIRTTNQAAPAQIILSAHRIPLVEPDRRTVFPPGLE